MKNIINALQLVFTALGGYIGLFLGGFDGFLYALVVFVVIDYITGVMLAVLNKKLSSDIGFKGICKKVLIFTMVAIGHSVDSYILQNGSAVRTAVIFFYLSNEGISIIENASKMGLPIPDKLKDVLSKLSEEEEKHE